MTLTEDVAVAGPVPDRLRSFIRWSTTLASQAIVGPGLQPNFDYTIVIQGANLILALRARRPRIRRSQDGRKCSLFATPRRVRLVPYRAGQV